MDQVLRPIATGRIEFCPVCAQLQRTDMRRTIRSGDSICFRISPAAGAIVPWPRPWESATRPLSEPTIQRTAQTRLDTRKVCRQLLPPRMLALRFRRGCTAGRLVSVWTSALLTPGSSSSNCSVCIGELFTARSLPCDPHQPQEGSIVL
jgi:hypothetical protein